MLITNNIIATALLLVLKVCILPTMSVGIFKIFKSNNGLVQTRAAHGPVRPAGRVWPEVAARTPVIPSGNSFRKFLPEVPSGNSFRKFIPEIFDKSTINKKRNYSDFLKNFLTWGLRRPIIALILYSISFNFDRIEIKLEVINFTQISIFPLLFYLLFQVSPILLVNHSLKIL